MSVGKPCYNGFDGVYVCVCIYVHVFDFQGRVLQNLRLPLLLSFACEAKLLVYYHITIVTLPSEILSGKMCVMEKWNDSGNVN